jgi:hypothetical protein
VDEKRVLSFVNKRKKMEELLGCKTYAPGKAETEEQTEIQ